MDLLILLILFTIIILFLKKGIPLPIGMAAATILGFFLYRIPPADAVHIVIHNALSLHTIFLILAFYSITFVQRMMEKRGMLLLAEHSLERMFHSKRVNCMVAPFVIGLLPSPGAVLIASPIVDNGAEGYLDREEKTFVTSYFRHISELFLPTYASILLALQLSGVDMTAFVLWMMPLALLLFALGYAFYVRKIPKSSSPFKRAEFISSLSGFFRGLWPILLTITIILSIKTEVFLAVLPVAFLLATLGRFSARELFTFSRTAFEPKIILTTLIIMIFKGLLEYSGVVASLPTLFRGLPIPSVWVFCLIFFLGTIVAGSQAMIAIILPMAFTTIPQGSVGALILFLSISYIAMQISPTHICLAIITEETKTSFLSLVKKTLPVLIVFSVISCLYAWLLMQGGI